MLAKIRIELYREGRAGQERAREGSERKGIPGQANTGVEMLGEGKNSLRLGLECA